MYILCTKPAKRKPSGTLQDFSFQLYAALEAGNWKRTWYLSWYSENKAQGVYLPKRLLFSDFGFFYADQLWNILLSLRGGGGGSAEGLMFSDICSRASGP